MDAYKMVVAAPAETQSKAPNMQESVGGVPGVSSGFSGLAVAAAS